MSTAAGTVAVGVDARNAADGRTRPGVWLSSPGGDWRRVPASFIDIAEGLEAAGVVMGDVTGSEEGRLVAVGHATFEPREEPLSWMSVDGGQGWAATRIELDSTSAAMRAVTRTGDRFVAVGTADGVPASWTSRDGSQWVRQPSVAAEGSFHEVAAHAGRLLAISTVGDSSQLWVADHTETLRWEPVESQPPPGGTLSALATAGEVVYAVGATRPSGVDHDGLLLRSEDGVTWEVDDRTRELGGPADQLPAAVLIDGDDVIIAGQDDGRAAIWTSTPQGDLRPLPRELSPDGSHAAALVATRDTLLALGTADRDTGPDVMRWSRERDTAAPAPTSTATCNSTRPPDVDGVPPGWAALAPPPLARARPGVVETHNQLLLMGGDTNLDGKHHTTVMSYDPDDDVWTCASPAPFSPGRGELAWTGELIYAWGGNGAAAYDPSTDAWRALPAPPQGAPPDPLAVVWTGQELLVWGSTDRDVASTGGVAYHPATRRWRPLPDAPVAINQGQGVWTGREMVVYGAQLDDSNHATTPTSIGAAYDPAHDTWRRLPPLELSPQATSIVWTGTTLLAWDYELASGAYDPATNSWTRLPDLPLEPSECYPASAVLEDGRVFAWFCGQAGLFEPQSGDWTEIETPITTHWRRPAVGDEVEQIPGTPISTGDQIYLAGASHEGHLNALWRWEPET